MSDKEPSDPGLLLIDEIYDALEGGDPGRALAMAHAALNEARDDGEDDPVIRFLSGVALLELDQPKLAADELARAVAADPDDAEFRSHLSKALFRGCRFDEAAEAARAAVACDDSVPDAHWALGMSLEREGLATRDFGAADQAFARATAIDDERFPAPVRLPRSEFEAQLAAAIDRLPADYVRHFDQVAVTAEDLPTTAVLLEEQPPLDPELLGLFVGAPLGEPVGDDPGGRLPARILVFQRNLERMVLSREELLEEIAVTVWHELGHYLGLDEDELEAVDLG